MNTHDLLARTKTGAREELFRSSTIVQLAWANLNRMRLRVVMTSMGVLIGTAVIVILLSLVVGLRRGVFGDLSSLGPMNRVTVFPGAFLQALGAPSGGDDTSLTLGTLDRFRQMDDVAEVTPTHLAGLYTVGRQFLLNFAGLYTVGRQSLLKSMGQYRSTWARRWSGSCLHNGMSML